MLLTNLYLRDTLGPVYNRSARFDGMLDLSGTQCSFVVEGDVLQTHPENVFVP